MEKGENAKHNTSESCASIFANSSRKSRLKTLRAQKQAQQMSLRRISPAQFPPKTAFIHLIFLTAGFRNDLRPPGAARQG